MDFISHIRRLVSKIENFLRHLKKKVTSKKALLFVLGALLMYKSYKFPCQIISSEFYSLISNAQVRSVSFFGDLAFFYVKGSNIKYCSNFSKSSLDSLSNALMAKGIDFHHNNYFENIIFNPYHQLLGIAFLFSFKFAEFVNDSTNENKSKARDTGITNISKAFESLVTSKENKDQFTLAVDQLVNPEKYKLNKIRPIKGILLYGKPGTGKTLVAKVSLSHKPLVFS